VPGIPAHFAVIGVGEDRAGQPVVVAFSPTRGADAALAALAVGARRQAEGAPDAALYAVAPDWNTADRRRLALLAPRLDFAAVAASGLVEHGVRIAADLPVLESYEPGLVAGLLARADERQLFDRALTALDGLAAKGIRTVWLNPGADGPEVVAHARALGLTVHVACSILAAGERPDAW